MPDFPVLTVRGLPMLSLAPKHLSAFFSALLESERRGWTIFTPNAYIGACCCRDAALHALLCRADILLPDGVGVLMASRREHRDTPLRHRLPGIEAGERVLQLCATRGLPVYFLGGKPGVATRAARAWEDRLPDLFIAGTHHGYFEEGSREEADILRDIRSSGAEVVLACLGFPRQERWIVMHRKALPKVRLWMGLGGSLDVWAGEIARAPAFFRHLRCEWLWRMLRQPHRFAQLPAMISYVMGTLQPRKLVK